MATALAELLRPLNILEAKGPQEMEIEKIEFDSRKAGPRSVFVAVRGTQTDGHCYIAQAVEAGSTAVVCEAIPEAVQPGIAYIRVANASEALGLMADVWHGHPSRQLKLVGVTGTNGKTTTVTLLYDLFSALGYKAGLLSTVRNKIGAAELAATHTTPDALSIHGLLREMVDTGCDFAFMEVSSHAAHQRRIAGLHFAGGVFTNITHDHLDYHKTFKAYIEAKKMFFDILPATAFALVNLDDKRGGVMLQNTKAGRYTFSLREMADFRARLLGNNMAGLHLMIDGQEVYSRLMGEFNAYNLLAVYGVACLLGQDPVEALTAASQLKAAEGRFDYVSPPGASKIGIVDYAHTPDALEKVLQTIAGFLEPGSRVITVVGCGGDRDKAKRPVMAEVACRLSQQVVLTSDNPRTEDPEQILKEMQAGVPGLAAHMVLSIVNRKEAIRTAVALAQPGDVILVAGKGHEKYQEIGQERLPFDDKAVLAEALEQQP